MPTGILIKIGQLQHAQGRLVFCQLTEGHTGEVDTAELHLLDDALFRSQLSPAVNEDLYPSAGALGHEVCKGECCLCGGVVLRLVLGVAQNQLRARLVLYRLMAAAGNRQRQHRRTEQSGKHLAAGHGWTSRAAFAASLRY